MQQEQESSGKNIWIEWDRWLETVRILKQDKAFDPGPLTAFRALRRAAGKLAVFAKRRGHPITELHDLRVALNEAIGGDYLFDDSVWDELTSAMRRADQAVDEFRIGQASAASAPKGEAEIVVGLLSDDHPPKKEQKAAADARTSTNELLPTCEVTKTGTDVVTVTEGGTSVMVRGPRRAWLLLEVFQKAGQPIAWDDLVKADIRNAAAQLDRRSTARASSSREATKRADLKGSPKMATQAATLQNLGSRIRKDLGKLNYHWQQDGHGVVWSAACQ